MNSRARTVLLALLLVSPLLALPAQAADAPESRFYAEFVANAYAGSDAYSSQEAYLDFALNDHISLWANPYREPGYASTTFGLAWTAGPWTFALGAGRNRYEGERANILAPWLSYASDDVELVLTAERYDNGEPAFWQGYAQRRVGRHFIGAYGETDVGIGPAATFVVNDHVRVRLAVPVAGRGDAKALVTVIVVP